MLAKIDLLKWAGFGLYGLVNLAIVLTVQGYLAMNFQIYLVVASTLLLVVLTLKYHKIEKLGMFDFTGWIEFSFTVYGALFAIYLIMLLQMLLSLPYYLNAPFWIQVTCVYAGIVFFALHLYVSIRTTKI